MNHDFSDQVSSFHGRSTPERGFVVGYAYLIALLKKNKINVPLPDRLAITTAKHQRYDTEAWQVLSIRHRPENTTRSHLIFALKYEGIDLYIIKKLFEYTGESIVLEMIKEAPTSKYARKVWFLYEWLYQVRLDIPDLTRSSYVDVVDSKLQYAGNAINSSRHRIRNNLPGTQAFCPMIRKTKTLQAYIAKNLSQAIDTDLSGRDKDLIRRTAAFLLLKDSKASFAIEGESPPSLRAKNWGRAIGQAGRKPLTISELERLQDIVIGLKKLKNMGLRTTEGFIGEHDRDTFSPLPEHISAKCEDVRPLIEGLLEANSILQDSDYDPVLAAATISFGFVFIHPFSDGNGRIHRYLMHHLLARMDYIKRGMIFPVSAAILQRIDEYQSVLESHSSPRLDLIRWESTPDHNVKVLNDTIDLYRYFDLTAQAEFLYTCISDTIETIIPQELDYLDKHDRVSQAITSRVSLPNTRVDLLIKLLDQNSGVLSRNKRLKEFSHLSDADIRFIESSFHTVFNADRDDLI